MKTLFNGLVLELVEQTNKESGKVYHSLIGYEFGRYGNETDKINLKPEQVPQARTLVGKKCEIVCDVFKTKSGFQIYNFLEGRAL